MDTNNIQIKEATIDDFNSVMEVEKMAFNSDIEAALVADLLNDISAKPVLSLLAVCNGEAVGHLLFTKVKIGQNNEVLAHILAPLAVKPAFQKQGVGTLLVKHGLEILMEMNSEVVFVLGHTDYYPKFGFLCNAESKGFIAPYPIPEEHADAWMIMELQKDALKKYSGKVCCADALQKPEYWSE